MRQKEKIMEEYRLSVIDGSEHITRNQKLILEVLLDIRENLTKHNNDFKKVCPECSGEGKLHSRGHADVDCILCGGTGKPIPKS